ncbi:hypothetical protein RM572_13305 [Streptomyces sp. DSM 42041]|uniref:Uncharacterized protein n=1 Tax=Streptomyces hazeniae TaxID=3075538 RepID=A0ABU2NUS3_9ACTN|nr:hypothetical protein [Streptomyces sp. DSM 42041]MDT0379742.1 hypothetical protein [Streptomyces sp. DSM 42041]
MADTGYPTRRTEHLRTATVWVAVGAILLSLWALWDFWDRRHTIDEACAGLVPADEVLDLSLSGGDIAGREAGEGRIDRAQGFPQGCDVFSGESADAAGSEAEHLLFFTAEVTVEPVGPSAEQIWEVDAAGSFSGIGEDAYARQPVGDGIDGTIGEDDAYVRLACTGGSGRGGRRRDDHCEGRPAEPLLVLGRPAAPSDAPGRPRHARADRRRHGEQPR